MFDATFPSALPPAPPVFAVPARSPGRRAGLDEAAVSGMRTGGRLLLVEIAPALFVGTRDDFQQNRRAFQNTFEERTEVLLPLLCFISGGPVCG